MASSLFPQLQISGGPEFSVWNCFKTIYLAWYVSINNYKRTKQQPVFLPILVLLAIKCYSFCKSHYIFTCILTTHNNVWNLLNKPHFLQVETKDETLKYLVCCYTINGKIKYASDPLSFLYVLQYQYGLAVLNSNCKCLYPIFIKGDSERNKREKQFLYIQ